MTTCHAASLSLTAGTQTRVTRGRFEALATRYAPDLYRYALWLARERATAEDLVQETLLRAWRSLHNLRDEAAAKAWLFTILRRENARLYERYRPELVDIEPTLLADTSHNEGTELKSWLLRRHIADLPIEYREPLVLQIVGGFSCGEIGQMLDLTRGAVMTRVFRAKQKLRAKLDGE